MNITELWNSFANMSYSHYTQVYCVVIPEEYKYTWPLSWIDIEITKLIHLNVVCLSHICYNVKECTALTGINKSTFYMLEC